MRFFREMKLSLVLIFNFCLGILTGWFFYQALRLLFGFFKFTGTFWRVLGIQYAFFIFIVVYLLNSALWKKKRTKMPYVKDLKLGILKLIPTILCYAAGCLLVNFIISIIK